MYAHNRIVLQLISLLKQYGIRRIVVSPGCRHMPLVNSLERDPYFIMYSVVDERSAGFFAIGLIQRTGEPVAVACTSGTACQNLGSSVAEAFYQKLPLLVLSGDRLPALLNQGEDLMYDQASSFCSITKYHTRLPYIQSDIDEWHCNRLINEGLIELTCHGKGPVHIDFPIVECFNVPYDVETLPVARKITWHSHSLPESDWESFSEKLRGKKVAIVWGQSVDANERMKRAVDTFCSVYDAVILTDIISNCHCKNAITNSFVLLSCMNWDDRSQLSPDIIISVGGTYFFINSMIQYAQEFQSEHWQVGNETKVCDPFHNLREVFEMDEVDFFERMSECSAFQNVGNYAESWKMMSLIPSNPLKPNSNEAYSIGRLLVNLPSCSSLQLANSMSIRFANFFPIDPSVIVNCNRGISGIDGSLSTMVGFSSGYDGGPSFYITGDLSFLYDMNALSIRHLRKGGLRILMINNCGGAVLWAKTESMVDGRFPINCAAGNNVNVQPWVESCGFQYLQAHPKKK